MIVRQTCQPRELLGAGRFNVLFILSPIYSDLYVLHVMCIILLIVVKDNSAVAEAYGLFSREEVK
jgi:hypothetical protein